MVPVHAPRHAGPVTLAAFLPLVVAGCGISHSTYKDDRTLAIRWTSEIGEPSALWVATTVAGSNVDLALTHQQECVRSAWRKTRTTTLRKAHLGSAPGVVSIDAWDPAVLVAPVAPVMFLGTLVTAIVVEDIPPKVIRREVSERLAFQERHDCSQPAAGAPIEVVLPSGARMHVATNRNGRVSFEVPPSESAAGEIALAIAGESGPLITLDYGGLEARTGRRLPLPRPLD